MTLGSPRGGGGVGWRQVPPGNGERGGRAGLAPRHTYMVIYGPRKGILGQTSCFLRVQPDALCCRQSASLLSAWRVGVVLAFSLPLCL